MVTIFKKSIFAFAFLILFLNLTSAISIDIFVEPVFYEGENINFSYQMLSQQDEFVKYIANVKCMDSPEPLLQIEEINLNANELFFETYTYGVVDKNVKNGNCIASVSVLEPFQMSFSEIFEVITSLDFSFTPLFCKDSSCNEKTKVFSQGEKAYLDYESSVENPLVTAILKYPDESTKEISLPTSIRVNQIGNYELEIVASKEGYKTITKKEIFGVIEGEIYIGYEDISGNVELNIENSSRDIDARILSKENLKSENIFYWIGGLVILTLIILMIRIIIKNKNKNLEF
jgi:hypothetical protein